MSIDQYLSILVRHRRRTLPANGVRINFTNSTFYRTLIIKEIFKFGDMVLLYCLSTKSGDMSGRYNIRTDSFVTPLNQATPRPDEFISAVRGLVLWVYTAVTCDDPFVQTTNDSYHATFEDDSATLEIVSLGNTLRRSDGSEPSEGHQRDLEKYESKEVSLNGFIRRLPKGRVASERARQLARDVGLELADGETYVQPFIRSSWVLRKKEEK